jgi:hypothetical protein
MTNQSESRENPSQSQSDKFKEAAKEHGCDDDEKAWEERLKKVAKAKPYRE